ncbi:hypothetical protein BTR23_18660 [Alkalihalophilus pseudofirmus]|nr:hypothetical protein BTR23_18660 [Alkalihalophilus pseudofirmus]
MQRLGGKWINTEKISGYKYSCGHCGSVAGPSEAYFCKSKTTRSTSTYANIFICPSCNQPTYIRISSSTQVPGIKAGKSLDYLPEAVGQLYEEARSCISVNAFTASVIACRKLLMNTAVSKGAEEGKSFAHYVNFLKENHYIPPQSEEWVDHIRKKGNEANHEIKAMNREDTEELLNFIQLLLTNVYVMPGLMKKHVTP